MDFPPPRIITALCVVPLVMASCDSSPRENAKEPMEPYTPGLGEIMSFQQMRHAKLWFAGENGNWQLASYEIDELQEGFADAVNYHPTFKNAPAPLAGLIAQFVDPPLARLRMAVNSKDPRDFTAAYDALTASCNSCHAAARFGFNVVKCPVAPPFGNQDFAVKH